MGKSSSADLRVRFVREIERGHSGRAAELRFGVAPSTAIRLAQRKAQTGSLAPAKQGRPAGSGRLAAHMDALTGWVEEQGDITLPELAARLFSPWRVRLAWATPFFALRARSLRARRRLMTSAINQSPPDRRLPRLPIRHCRPAAAPCASPPRQHRAGRGQ